MVDKPAKILVRLSGRNILRCVKTGKVCFPDKETADKRLAHLQFLNSTNLKRSYRCTSCKHYHLTSEATKQNRRKRVRQREKLIDDGSMQSRRVSKHNDDLSFRKSIENSYAELLGLKK